MINRLINMNINPSITKLETINKLSNMNNGNYTVEEYATAFIEGMGETQRERFKKMLENGIQCGFSVAENYGIDYDEFINEVKKQMEV